jgi:hypothetical protein
MQWLALRANDRFDANVGYQPPPPGPGVWEPTAPTPPVDVKMAQVRPYVMRSPDRFRPSGPRGLESRAYARAFDEVYDVGRLDSVSRTSEQLDVARFWAEHTAVQWNRNLRQLAAAAQLDLVGTARMLAMVHVASADATVGCFDAKYSFLFWRPVHAIQRADTDGNPRTSSGRDVECPVEREPPGVSVRALVLDAGRDRYAHVLLRHRRSGVRLDSTVTGTTRQYARFSEVAEEVQDARVWAGIHFRFSTDDGAAIGRQVARLVTRHHFRPVKP